MLRRVLSGGIPRGARGYHFGSLSSVDEAHLAHGSANDREALPAARVPSVSPTLGATGIAASLLATSSVVLAEADAAATTAAAAAAETGMLSSVLAVAGPICFGFLQVSGLKTVKEIKDKGTTGDLSPLQFVSLAVNCSVWVLYGILRWDMTVLLPNFSGLLFGLYYTSVYAKYTPTPITKYLAGGTAIAATAGGIAATMPAATAATSIGLIGCTMAVILMSAPLATMKQVIATGDTSSMPFNTSLATLLNAISWTGYGAIVAHDPLIWGPNALGLVAASVQMGLFAKFGITAPKVDDPKAPAGDDMSPKSK